MDPTEDREASSAQAKELLERAKAGGLRFQAYLPPDLATWLLEKVARGDFADPSEAVFVILGEHEDLELHVDLRREAFRRKIQASMDDPRPGIPAEDVIRRLRERLAAPLPEPAIWPPRKPLDRSSLTVGDTFWCGDRQWRCTDIGTRVITAIRIDHVDVSNSDSDMVRSLTRDEAEAEGWFKGPPYAVAEVEFDEDDLQGCSIESPRR